MKIKAVYTSVIAKKLEEDKTSAGGIILVQKDKMTHAEVLDVGPKVNNIKVGDIITYDETDNKITTETIDNQKIMIIPYSSVLGIIED